MTIPIQRPAAPPIPNLTRKIAVRKLLVDHLVGLAGAETFLRVIPALLAALEPHLAPPPAPAPAPAPAPMKPQRPLPGHNGLTEREMQVLRLVARGNSNSEVGEHLYLTADTVKTHLRRVYRKLGARDRAHAVAIGYMTRILP